MRLREPTRNEVMHGRVAQLVLHLISPHEPPAEGPRAVLALPNPTPPTSAIVDQEPHQQVRRVAEVPWQAGDRAPRVLHDRPLPRRLDEAMLDPV